VEAETALVWTEGRVELHTVALVDLALALVVLPDDAELDDALGNGDDLESLPVLGVLLEDGGAFQGGDELYEMSADCCAVAKWSSFVAAFSQARSSQWSEERAMHLPLRACSNSGSDIMEEVWSMLRSWNEESGVGEIHKLFAEVVGQRGNGAYIYKWLDRLDFNSWRGGFARSVEKQAASDCN
jgi:hypothetical protein